MRRSLLGPWACVAALGLLSCKDPETQAVEAQLRTTSDKLAEGRRLLAAGKHVDAIEAFQAAASVSPADPVPVLLLAQAQREAGNDGAAILALKQATELTRDAEPSLRKQLADLYVQVGDEAEAIEVLTGLRDSRQLAEPEVLALARMQARGGDLEGARRTLEQVRQEDPEDLEAQVVQAELLLLGGDEPGATRLMDGLLSEHPDLVSARLLRAQYLLDAGDAESAEVELARIEGEGAERADVVAVKARVLDMLERYDEAEEALRQVLERNPRDVHVLAQLAEVKLHLGETAATEGLVEKALGIRPRFARALYVRGRAREEAGDLKGATDSYRQALASSPTFAPALSRMWRIQRRQDNRTEAISTLERLLFMTQASLEEKVALAELYLETRSNLDRARKLVEDLLRREPRNAHYRALRARLPPLPKKKKPRGPEIIRFRR